MILRRVEKTMFGRFRGFGAQEEKKEKLPHSSIDQA